MGYFKDVVGDDVDFRLSSWVIPLLLAAVVFYFLPYVFDGSKDYSPCFEKNGDEWAFTGECEFPPTGLYVEELSFVEEEEGKVFSAMMQDEDKEIVYRIKYYRDWNYTMSGTAEFKDGTSCRYQYTCGEDTDAVFKDFVLDLGYFMDNVVESHEEP